jgi:hypothetical protein
LKFLFVMCFIFQLSTSFASDTAVICEGKKTASGEKHGIWICKKNGLIIKKERYKKGLLQTYIVYNNKGEIIETRTRKGQIKKYEPCGCY